MNGSEVAGHNWWTAPSGVNGLQTAATESFEVEEVPYSSNAKEILRMVYRHITMAPLLRQLQVNH